MNWDLFLPLVITVLIATTGWIVAHRLDSARDRASKRRELRTQYLISAFRTLAKTSERDVLHPYAEEIESAVTDIQLFGSPRQIEMVVAYVDELVATYEADIDDLLNDLRGELRAELDLPPAPRNLRQIRIRKAGSDDSDGD